MDVRVYVVLLHEDDPKKNTALKMIRSGLATPISGRVRREVLTLNPYSGKYVGPWLRDYVAKNGILAVDASWKRLEPNKFRAIRGLHARLPPLLPGNPINYGRPCVLSTIEAVAAALYITGFFNMYERLIKLYKWMSTFHTLNENLLKSYSKVVTTEELIEVIVSYWGVEDPCLLGSYE